ncbi:MAG: hypothetical protein HYX79_06590 [Chloroflexi bacterium]|nr:hypothetical protein [Chloroflexota bacterium]
MQKAKVIQCGLGAIGVEVSKLILEKKDIELVAATDIAKQLIDKDLGQVLGLERKLGIKVRDDAGEVFRKTDADVVVVTTSSHFERIFGTVREALSAGKNVITTCEDACFPWTRNPDLSRQIDELAKSKGVTFLGTGINPGFMMDYLPIALTGIMKRVDKVRIRRVANMATCGLTDWELFGYGKKLEAFNEGLAKGQIGGFIAFRQIMEMIARALQWGKIDYEEEKEGLITRSRRVAKAGVVEPGTVYSVKQTARGLKQGKEVIAFEEFFVINPSLEEDDLEVGNFATIEGEPSVVVNATGQQASQMAATTAAHVVNSIPAVIEGPPGLLTVYELPPSPCLPGKE